MRKYISRAGFANPEYMIALATVGIFLAIAIPQLAKFREQRRTRRTLATVRDALARYTQDTKLKGPAELSDLTKDGKYLSSLPAVSVWSFHRASLGSRMATVETFMASCSGVVRRPAYVRFRWRRISHALLNRCVRL